MKKNKKMQIIIDLDGVIAEEKPTFERSLAKSIKGARKSISALFGAGHTIILYSARSWSEYLVTKNWLRKQNLKYHQLIMGKPVGDIWIDDRAIKFINWKKTFAEIHKINNDKNNQK